MSLIANLKRSGYIGTALVLMLAAMPVLPITRMIVGDGNVMAAPADHKVTNGSRSTLQNYLNNYGEAMLGSNVSSNNPNGQVEVTRDATLDLGGYNLNTNLTARGNITVTIYATGGGRVTRSLSVSNGGKFVIYGGTFRDKPQDAWLASGYEAVQNATDNSWTVREKPASATLTDGALVLMEGSTINVNDAVIGSFTNPEDITLKLVRGEAAVEPVTVSGTTVEDGVITANSVVGTDTLHFCISEECTGSDDLGQKVIQVFKKQNLADQLLSRSGVGAPTETTINIVDEGNMPGYTITSSDEDIVKVVATAGAVGSYTLTAVGGGVATVTIAYEGDGVYGEPSETFDVTVSDFWSDAEDRYTAKGGDTVEFTVSEEADQDAVSCTVDGVDCDESEDFTVTKDDAGKYSIEVGASVAGGAHTFTFTDSLISEGNVKTVEIYVYEIVLEQREYYIEAEAEQEFTVKERNDNGHIRARVVDADGGTVNDASISCSRKTSNRAEYGCTFSASEAGEYTVEIVDQNRWGSRIYDTERVKMHVYDFEVSGLEYHVRSGDSANKFISAINHYWEDTAISGAIHSDGNESNRIRVNPTDGGYNFRMSRLGVGADKYTLEVSAFVGDRAVDSETVNIYVYNMTHPSQTTYYGEINENGDAYTFSGINVGDDLNEVEGLAGIAEITASVTSGNGDAVDLSEFEDGKITISEPGVYEVTYADTMEYGESNEEPETWTATFRVYGLSVEAEDEVLNLNANEVYDYAIDPSGTFGRVRTTIVYEDAKTGEMQEVLRVNKRYDDTTADKEEFTFDPAEYGEGTYTIRIENISTRENNRLATLSKEAVFYVVSREYDFVMVEQGKSVEIESKSDWSVDYAHEYYTGELTVDDGKVVVDTTELPLGASQVTLGHELDNGNDLTLKTVTIVVYKVTPADNTKELNPEVTVATLKDLYEKTAQATVKLARELIAEGMPEILVEINGYSTMIQMLTGNLTKEEIEELGLTELFEAYKTAFADDRDETGVQTAGILNLLSSGFLGLEGVEIETDVNVTMINNTISAEEKAAIKAALAGCNVDNIDYYDVSVLLKARGYEVGKLHQLNDKIVVALAEATDPATGYTRQYFVTRTHDGKVVVLEEGVDFYIENGVIYIISDQFSTYAVAYKDTLKTGAPDTGVAGADEAGSASANASVLTAVAVMLAVLGLAGIVKFAKKRG